MVAADPAGVVEEEGDEEDRGKQHDDVEEGVALDLDVAVVQLHVPPVGRLQALRRHGGSRDRR